MRDDPVVPQPERDVIMIPDAEARTPSGVLARYRRIAVALALTDAGCVLVALLVAARLSSVTIHNAPIAPIGAVTIAALVWVVVFHAFGLYTPQYLSPAEMMRRIIGASGVGVMLLALSTLWSSFPASRHWLAFTWFLALVLELLSRRIWAWRFGQLRNAGALRLRTLIIGSDDEARRLFSNLSVPGWGYDPLGFIALDGHADGDRGRVLDDIDHLEEAVETFRPDCLFVASAAVNDETVLRVTRVARQHRLEVRIAANIPRILTNRVTVQQISSMLALSLKPARLTKTQELMKRTFDIALASVGIVLTLPLLAATAAAIKLTSRGPVFFRQQRVTRDGRVFRVFKFRTMRHASGEPDIDTSQAFFKMENDPRLTKIGVLIRRLSLDEAPQLLNVVKGDMSLVGPRPLTLEQVEANEDLMRDRHEVPAGVTGWWQINGRSDVSPEEAVEFDLFYIQNWSLALDLYILLKTIGAVINQKGAY